MLDTDSPTLFKARDKRPLAEKLRPEKLSDVVGQAHLLDNSGSLQRMLNSKNLSSIIFWGPPGCGKTTIARLLAHQSSFEFVSISAVSSGVAELRRIFEDAQKFFENGKQTLIFVDEVDFTGSPEVLVGWNGDLGAVSAALRAEIIQMSATVWKQRAGCHHQIGGPHKPDGKTD